MGPAWGTVLAGTARQQRLACVQHDLWHSMASPAPMRVRRRLCSLHAASTDPSAQTAASPLPARATVRTFHHGITYTSYEGSCFAVRFNMSGAHVLVDPWFEGPVDFMGMPMLLRIMKRTLRDRTHVNVAEVAADTDVVLLSQHLDDHTHLPTLEQLPRHLHIIAQPQAAQRIAPLGFRNVTPLAPGQQCLTCGGRLRVQAVAGAQVGPPWEPRQNGYLLQEVVSDPDGGVSMFYEPHADVEERQLAALGKVDVLVTPPKSVLVGGLYPILLGEDNLPRLLKQLQPSVYVPLLSTEVDGSGVALALLQERGSCTREQLRRVVAASGVKCRVDLPAPAGESLAIAL